MVQLQIIGGGKMGSALLGGLIGAGWAPPGELRVVEADPDRRAALADEFPGVDVADAPGAAAGTILATKPQGITGCAAAAAAADGGRMVSIAAGVTVAQLEAAVPGSVAIRAMPNTPSLVGQGATAICAGASATPDDMAWARSVLEAVGMVVEVDEQQIDAITALSGSGPAYVFLVAEALEAAAVDAGLSAELAATLTAATIAGAGRLLVESDDSPAELRAAVTSPNGTTAAGIAALEAAGARDAFAAAHRAAMERSAEMSR